VVSEKTDILNITNQSSQVAEREKKGKLDFRGPGRGQGKKGRNYGRGKILKGTPLAKKDKDGERIQNNNLAEKKPFYQKKEKLRGKGRKK